MKKFGILMLSFLLIATFQSCEKKTFIDPEAPEAVEAAAMDEVSCDRYFLNGEEISKRKINFQNDELILLHGVLENKSDVMVFENRKDFFNWADAKKDANINQLVQGIKNADAAREYAIKTGEDLNGEPSEAFLKYLEENYGGDNKIGLGQLYEGYGNGGSWSYLLGSVPIARFKYPNEASCIEPFGRWYVLYDNTWWKGKLATFVGIGMSFDFPEEIDNKTESIWTI